MDQPLIQQKCEACEGWMKPLTTEQFQPLLQQITGWDVIEDVKIEKTFKFKNFKESLEFVNKVGAIAEGQGHHPNIFMYGWNKVRITLTTHAIKGLSKNDFIMAAKIDNLLTQSK